jgi:chromosome segregation ATPase
MMSWSEFMGIVTIIGTGSAVVAGAASLLSVFRDNKALKVQLAEVRRENDKLSGEHKGLSKDHQSILAMQNDSGKNESLLMERVGHIKDSLEQTQNRIENMNISDQKVHAANDLIQQYLLRESEEKQLLQHQVARLQLENEKQANTIEALEEELTEYRGLKPSGPSLHL